MQSSTFGRKYTFYRPEYVINFQAVVSQKSFNTVNIEIAPCVDKAAQWDKKITLQLSEVDLFKYFYTLSHGFLFKYESRYHGAERNKSISFSESSSGCKVSVSDKGKMFHFTCSVGEWFYGQMLILEQLLSRPLSLEEAKTLITVTKKDKKTAND